MPNALDTFCDQRAAAGQVNAALKETSELLRDLQIQVKAVTCVDELRLLVQQEQSWLTEAQRILNEVRSLQAQDKRRFRDGVIGRWTLALVFALASAFVVGAGYSLATKPYATEIVALRSRMDFAEFVERRVVTMTPAERRQFEALMRWDVPATKRDR